MVLEDAYSNGEIKKTSKDVIVIKGRIMIISRNMEGVLTWKGVGLGILRCWQCSVSWPGKWGHRCLLTIHPTIPFLMCFYRKEKEWGTDDRRGDFILGGVLIKFYLHFPMKSPWFQKDGVGVDMTESSAFSFGMKEMQGLTRDG